MTLLASKAGYNTSSWQTIYEIDFTTFGNVSVFPASLNGVTWNVYPSNSVTITAANGASITTDTNPWAPPTTLPPCLYLPLNNIPDFLGTKYLQYIKASSGIRIWAYSPGTPWNAQWQRSILAITNGSVTAKTGTYVTARRGWSTEGLYNASVDRNGIGEYNSSYINTNTNNVSVIEIPRIDSPFFQCLYGTWGVNWPSYNSLVYASSVTGNYGESTIFNTNPTFILSAQSYIAAQIITYWKNFRIDIKF